MLAGVVVGSVFTTIYSLRFLWGAFARKGLRGPSTRVAEAAPAAGELPGRPGVLAAAGLVFGLVARLLETMLDPYADIACPADRTTTSRCGTG